MIPNVEKIVVSHLLNDDDVTDILGAGNRVSTELPPGAALPRIRIALAGGTIPVRGWLYNVRVSVEGWGNTKDEAWDALNAALTSLQEGLDGALVDGGVVTAADQETGATWVPDPESNTPRYLATVSLTVHPEP